MRTECIILGGGASGLAAAAALGLRGVDCVVLERQARVGKKLLATGNGRCNLSNERMDPTLYGASSPFVAEVYAQMPPEHVLHFFESLGLLLAREDGRIYPRTMQASAVLDVLRTACERGGVHFETEREAVCLTPSRRGGWSVQTTDGEGCFAPVVLAAMGGCAAPSMGTDGSGARLLHALGHRVTPAYPALVQLVCRHPVLRSLKGLRAHAALTLLIDGREVAREEGELLFAEYGVSGVCVFQLSRFCTEACAAGRDVRLLVDLLPEICDDIAWLNARIDMLPDAGAQSLLTGVLPRMLAQAVVRQAKIEAKCPACELDAGQKRALWNALRRFPLSVSGTLDFEHAQVTRGGVALDEVDPKTMQSRLFDGLYLAGEMLDVDGPCGGYNLHFAFASGLLAAREIAEQVRSFNAPI